MCVTLLKLTGRKSCANRMCSIFMKNKNLVFPEMKRKIIRKNKEGEMSVVEYSVTRKTCRGVIFL